MGLLEDVSAWIAFYIVRPAINSFKQHASVLEKAMANVVEFKLRHFIRWIATLDTTIEWWVKGEIQKSLDAQQDGTWDFFGWINQITNSVFNSIKNLFVQVANLSNEVLKIIKAWWKSALDTVMGTLKDTFVSIADFTIDVTKIILEFGYEAFSVIIKTVGNMISVAVDVIATTVANLINSVATSISNIINSVATAVANIQSTITDFMVDITKSITDAILDINQFVVDKILEVREWVDETIPRVVEAMFGGIFDEGGLFGQLVGFIRTITEIFTGTAPKEQVIIDTEEKQKEIQAEIDNIMEEIG